MLSIFPIMFLSLLAHAILRVATGAVLIVFGIQNFRKIQSGTPHTHLFLLSICALYEVVCGVLLVVGYLTQVAALTLVGYALLISFVRRSGVSKLPASTRILLAGIGLSLFITGAGAFAVDMPF
jgi:uncharacterized membrane protein YphA (DoxX/SURF4 family)